MILSAKHGFLKADDIIHENYDVAFGTPHAKQITREELSQQFHQKIFFAYDELVVLGGKKYRKVIDPLLQPHQKKRIIRWLHIKELATCFRRYIKQWNQK
ncbi:hypothetical protein BsIDN1_15480 [Bacillus safensis]|uniref:DUF6884 domain-containing protein n=1 Tax=Bacillus safensis TaxID=561879 RepID=A0A5S9M2V9_BACIA|nr:hypothetical protein BsIDN1_15480 [Bacillus safensis]